MQSKRETHEPPAEEKQKWKGGPQNAFFAPARNLSIPAGRGEKGIFWDCLALLVYFHYGLVRLAIYTHYLFAFASCLVLFRPSPLALPRIGDGRNKARQAIDSIDGRLTRIYRPAVDRMDGLDGYLCVHDGRLVENLCSILLQAATAGFRL